jgi:hypothetical protein
VRTPQRGTGPEQTGMMASMKKRNKRSVADRFNKLDLHDDALLSMRIHPPHSVSNFSRVEFEFQDDSSGDAKVLSFRSCANFRLVMDFDVLASNWHFGNTEACVANIDVARLRQFMTAQLPHWRTKYMPPMSWNRPIKRKLESISSYALFRISFFGGAAEILAKNYRLIRQRPD